MEELDDVNNIVIDIPLFTKDLKKRVDEIEKQKILKEAEWMNDRNSILMKYVKQIMVRRLEGDTNLKFRVYVTRLRSISGTKEAMIFSFNASSNMPSNAFHLFVCTAVQTFRLVNGIALMRPSFETDLRILIDKGLFDVYCALEKRLDAALLLASAEPVAKRSKIDKK